MPPSCCCHPCRRQQRPITPRGNRHTTTTTTTTMALSSSSPLLRPLPRHSCLLPLLLRISLSALIMMMMMMMMIPPVHGYQRGKSSCSVLDRHGTKIQLDGPLPDGIEYRSYMDAVVCVKEYACHEYTFKSCRVVQCLGVHSCDGAKFEDNDDVSCENEMACYQAMFEDSHKVVCGSKDDATPDAQRYCAESIIEVDDNLYCFGSGTCQSESWEQRLYVAAGHYGRIMCNKFKYGEERGPTCKHISVKVKHADRACFSHKKSTSLELSRCAVHCFPDLDSCDRGSIQFEVDPYMLGWPGPPPTKKERTDGK